MIIFKIAKQLSAHLENERKSGQSIGFVPTMGALHQGHLSLIASSKAENNITVCSIFINPTQFNNPDDFNHYPVTIENDIKQLVTSDCDILFLPSAAEIYPSDYQKRHYELGPLEHVLEGYYRPGHFQGVCQVVDRLLTITAPDRLYLGQKDYQQCMVIQKLVQLLQLPVQLRLVQTKREDNGLAMSSRNLRLLPEQKIKAHLIADTLLYIKNNWKQQPLETVKAQAVQQLSNAGFSVDYVEIADAQNLLPATNDTAHAIALVAASLGNIRLIDNMLLN